MPPVPTITRGLTADVLRLAIGDTSLRGLSSAVDRLTVVGVVRLLAGIAYVSELPEHARLHQPTPDAPPVYLVCRPQSDGQIWHLAPVCASPTTSMFSYQHGGNAARLGDCRLRELVPHYGPVWIHDRVEHPHEVYVSHEGPAGWCPWSGSRQAEGVEHGRCPAGHRAGLWTVSR